MIQEAYCSYEVSKLLKDAGFDGECLCAYSQDEIIKGLQLKYEKK